ncbi:SGNH/GDSL hydrolase family protein [Alteromonas macleodii]|uniref:SGNH hydrolase-type esterase domain-containing protein n=1 Tax=Alteromonas macleodii TaxID=28108 RepID=A0A6T9Y6N4_ALTMA|nr:SGNH/GDSL hydrolase family protein [Alteromonas macleodii]CAB9495508.1 conserved protein of unknown function [Alteromonas macleodii]
MKELLVLGDSHALTFEHSQRFKKKFCKYSWDSLIVVGATISGLQNPNSKTQAMPLFIDKLGDKKRDTILILLGEVDLGFIVWFRAQKYNEDVNVIFDDVVLKYQEFINYVKRYCDNLIVISAPLPTIPDDRKEGEVAQLRASIKATQEERTHLTVKFNLLMQKWVIKSGYSYLNLDEACLGDNGLVINDLLNSEKADHHYDKKKYTDLLLTELENYLDH